jgi:hypothetical protein
MIYSPGRRYLFIHAPKTGGTAMALALEGRAMKDDLMLGDTPKALRRRHRLEGAEARGRLWKHSTLADLDGVVPRDALDDLFVFTLVRNPWDRTVSYYHWLREQTFSHPAVRLALATEFEDFVQQEPILASFRASPARTYVSDPDGRERASLYIRLENFASDAQPLWDHLGFSLTLPHCNASDRDSDYRAYYSPKSRAAIAESCAEDIAKFDYSFD